MIYELKIELRFGAFCENDWTGFIEIDSSDVLEDLHLAIQEAVCFDDDHLYHFYIARTDRSREQKIFNDKNRDIYNIKIGDIFPLEKGRHLYYLFDYGDNWLFKVSKVKEFAPDKKVKYPNLVREIGTKPIQYPDFDE